MDYKLVITLWAIFAVSVVYWDMHRYDDVLVSKCHQADITFIHEKPMCTECKLYCEIE